MIKPYFERKQMDDFLDELIQKRTFLNEREVVFTFTDILEEKGFPWMLEYPSNGNYEDIRFAADNQFYIVEFKYCPSSIKVNRNPFHQTTRHRSSSARMDKFLDGIKRTENTIKTEERVKGGFCVFITNEEKFIKGLPSKLKGYKFATKLFSDLTLFVVSL